MTGDPLMDALMLWLFYRGSMRLLQSAYGPVWA
jgi:hypothetical protein